MGGQYKFRVPFTLSFIPALVLLISQLGIVHPPLARAATGAFVIEGDNWTYFKGEVEPPIDWNTLGFDDSSWLSGPTGIGYGDGDDATILSDMQGNYISVYMRRTFTVADPSSLSQLSLKIDYDDGFVAYLNGVEVARRNLGSSGSGVPYNMEATSSREAGVFEVIDISPHLNDLVTGTNVLAIQVHNRELGNSDLSIIPALHWDDNSPNIIRYPYLQKLSTNTVTIVWTTSEPGPSEVRYSTDLSYSSVVAATSTFKSVDAPAPYDNYYEHVVVLSNLTIDTIYNYAIYTQGTRLAPNKQLHFRTHPGFNTCTFNFAFLADTQNHIPYVRDPMVARGFDFALIGGDLTEHGTYEELETKFFDLYQDILSNQMMWPILGNHDYYDNCYDCDPTPYLDIFHLPEQALDPEENELYYSFDYGNAHFVMLNTWSPLWQSRDYRNDDMIDWLEADLTTNNSFWTIAVIHHPWYVSDTRGHSPSVHDKLVPLFEVYGVDIVFTGHDHLYERTSPIKNDVLSTVEVGGVVYVTNGEGSGAGAYYSWIEPAPEWSAFRSNHTYDENYNASYTHIYIDNGVMSLITIDDQENVIDPVGSTDPIIIIDRSNEPGALCNTNLSNINGTVYEDNDGNGSWSGGDTPLANIQIDLSNGQSTVTNNDGFYQFINLTPGNYIITENDPLGYFSSGDVEGANDNRITVNLQSGQAISSQNFFDYRPGTISGTVYEDTDGNGTWSVSDTPLAGVQIDLSNGQNTTTDATGVYTFINLIPDSYIITENDLPSYTSVADVDGTNDNLISIILVSGDEIGGQDFLDMSSLSGDDSFSIYLPLIIKSNSD